MDRQGDRGQHRGRSGWLWSIGMTVIRVHLRSSACIGSNRSCYGTADERGYFPFRQFRPIKEAIRPTSVDDERPDLRRGVFRLYLSSCGIQASLWFGAPPPAVILCVARGKGNAMPGSPTRWE